MHSSVPRPPSGSYSPRGVTRPIGLRLLPEERQRIEILAKHEGRAVAALSRILVLRGLADYETDLEKDRITNLDV